MNRRWSEDAERFAESVTGALARLGGIEFTRRAEADPSLRRSQLQPLLESLGMFEIDALNDAGDAEAAAAAARAAGAVVMPWPLAAQLAGGPGPDARPTYLALGYPQRLEHLDLFDAGALVADVSTRLLGSVAGLGPVVHMPLDPFAVHCEVQPGNGAISGDGDVSRAVDANIVLTAFYVLGALEAAVAMTAAYAAERRQFGQPIAAFGAIQWRLSDIVVARDGLAELAGYTLWRFATETATPADTLALRLAMVEAADAILSNAHQVFGAIGLCEEHDLTVIDRHLQATLRRAGGTVATTRILRDAVVAYGFDGVFGVAPAGRDRAAAVG